MNKFLTNIIAFIVITLAVLGGYALYKGSFSLSIKDGVPSINAANYKDAEPVSKLEGLAKKFIKIFQ